MKKYLALIVIAATLACGSGCKTSQTPTSITYKVEGVIITSVDTGMKAWADQVRAGNATQEQIDKVKEAYNDYYAAQQVAYAALTSYIATKDATQLDKANQAVASAQSSLLSLLNQYILK